jgi:hypothetical protein
VAWALGAAPAAAGRLVLDIGPILVRADCAGATHAFTDELALRGLEFSIGFPLEAEVKAAILAAPAR